MENIVEFTNKDGEILRGILHEPDPPGRNSALAVVLLNAGIDDRTGPHRLNIMIARRLCREGVSVLRFDFHGVGISDGDLQKGANTDHFIAIEKGRYVDDTLAAVAFMKQRLRPARLIAVGLCAGGMTGLMAGSRCKDIDGIAAIDPVVYLHSAGNGKAISIEVKVVADALSKKFLQRETWRKLLTDKLDLQYLAKILYLSAKLKLAGVTGDRTVTAAGHPLNSVLIESFRQYAGTKRKILFILGDKDIAASEFKYNFQNKYITPAARPWCSVVTVAGANHEFHSLPAQKMLLDVLSSWAAQQSAAHLSEKCHGIR